MITQKNDSKNKGKKVCSEISELESWDSLKGFNNYEINRKGRVRNKLTGREVGAIDEHGYVRVVLLWEYQNQNHREFFGKRPLHERASYGSDHPGSEKRQLNFHALNHQISQLILPRAYRILSSGSIVSVGCFARRRIYELKQLYNTALYMRLSRDDENYGDSISIETQRTLLRQFAKENGFRVVDEYVDDGWSGTNFDRPDFQRMMEDVEAGKINCIVTKDLSRFGREHVMMDYYLEFLFPEKHIRYIAVTDNEDTEKGLSDFVPFKNLFNEWYAKDTSRKVKAAQKAKFLAGEKVFTHAPIGYKRNPDNSNSLVIDEETKWIIEKIFDMAAHGSGACHIAHTLTKEGVPTPGWMNYRRYGTFAHIYADRDDYPGVWAIKEVQKILTSETYIGNCVHYVQTKISYKNKKLVRNPPEKWVRIENTHEPIVSKEVFEKVQQQIANRKRSQKDGTTQIFAGLLKCADCVRAMQYTGIYRDQ